MKWVYLFAEAYQRISAEDRRKILGGKGAGLVEMVEAGLPVPPGFIISTEACNAYFAAGNKLPDELWGQVLDSLNSVENQVGRRFGESEAPLLVSVRSGARVSMPGMLDTILNVGLTDRTVMGLAEQTGNERFAYDTYRRFIQMFGQIVQGIPKEKFERVIDRYMNKVKKELSVSTLKKIIDEFKRLYRQEVGEEVPQDPFEQLREAIKAVFDSWFGKRAVDYRNFYKIPHDWGTACIIQSMVFGNMGFDSATGVAFTRNPVTGEKEIYGEYLPDAQGEEVVSGERTPLKITKRASQRWAKENGVTERDRRQRYPSLEEVMPAVYCELLKFATLLERYYRDVQDFEFTIERGCLWLLQTRAGKRTARAAVKVAVDMVYEGIISKKEAILRVKPEHVDQLLLPCFDETAKERARREGRLLARGLNASPGAATGYVVFDADTAELWGRDGRPVILVRPETTPDDVHGMIAACGILTQRGGVTSHAAVVARGIGRPAVVGCESLHIDQGEKRFDVNGYVVCEGEFVSIDGGTGEVFLGRIPTVEPDLSREKELSELLTWADEFSILRVWANADTPTDALKAREFGAKGIGLARTEHMFLSADRLSYVRQMILQASEVQQLLEPAARIDSADREKLKESRTRNKSDLASTSEAVKNYRDTINRLLTIQRKDFAGLFKSMDGLPVVIRLIDPPMHEFLPSYESLLEEVVELRTRIEIEGRKKNRASKSRFRIMKAELTEKERLLQTVGALREINPMLGLRGIRLGIVHPEIVRLQIQAIFEAACDLARRGIRPKLKIMAPLSIDTNELRVVREEVESTALSVMKRKKVKVEYEFGTMIEAPRAALIAGDLAKIAEFFSFGTNDLTQMVWGISRDDAEGKFLLRYIEKGIISENPFQKLDRLGVGRLMRWAIEEGRRTRPNIELGICGEQGGDSDTIDFCHDLGLNYVSVSPYRVPSARLAAARAALARDESLNA